MSHNGLDNKTRGYPEQNAVANSSNCEGYEARQEDVGPAYLPPRFAVAWPTAHATTALPL